MKILLGLISLFLSACTYVIITDSPVDISLDPTVKVEKR